MTSASPFPAPENGSIIVTIENATGLFDVTEMKTRAGNTEVKIKATAAMFPNAYLYVTMLQPHAQTVNDAPVRLYGVIPVMVEDPATKLLPVITMPDKIRSQQEIGDTRGGEEPPGDDIHAGSG